MPISTHWSQLLILIVLALLIFGPKRLPEMGAAVAKTLKEFRKSMRAVTEPEETPILILAREAPGSARTAG